MGYTVVFAPGNDELVRTYRLFPDLVKVILLESPAIFSCFENGNCLKSPSNPRGVPIWKMLAFHFWQGSAHPLGGAWTVGPEQWGKITPSSSAENVYMGYSIERTCTKKAVIPFEERPHQVYILAKYVGYFYDKSFPWTNDTFKLGTEYNVSFVAGSKGDEGATVPEGVKNLGILKQNDFFEQVKLSTTFFHRDL
jgi:hypothetical protein